MMADVPGLDRFDQFHHRTELRRLRRFEADGILSVVAGLSDGKGLLVCTKLGLTWIPGRRLRRNIRLPWSAVRGLRIAEAGELALLTADGDGIQLVIARLSATAARALYEAACVAARKSGTELGKVDTRPPEEPAPDVTGRIERLDRMFAKGAITHPEYQANRRRLAAEVLPDPTGRGWVRRW